MAVKQQAMMNGMLSNADRDKVILRIDEDPCGEEEERREQFAENSKLQSKLLTGIANEDEQSSSLERNNSYFFQGDVDPPSKLIEKFLQRQKELGDYQLDPGVERVAASHDQDLTFWESPKSEPSDLSQKPAVQQGPSVPSSPPTRRSSMSESLRSRRRSFNIAPESPLHRVSSGFNKSRFVEQPPRSGLLKSGLLKSGLLNNNNNNNKSSNQNGQDSNAAPQQEEDPLDLPEDWKKESQKTWDLCLFFEWLLLVLSIGALVCSTTISILKQQKLLGLDLWRWCVLGLVILGGRLLSGWIIRLIVFFIERNFILRKRLVYFVYGLQKGVQKCLWFGIILLAWRLIFDPNLPRPIRRERKMLQIVTKILVCLLLAASLWLLKILLVKVLALNFHVNTYFDRIQESLFNQYILEALSSPPLLEHQIENSDNNNHSKSPPPQQQQQQQPRKSGNLKSGNLGENGITLENLQRMNQKNISAWNMKRLIRLAKSSRITTLAENLDSDSSSSTGDAKKNGIESEWQARAAAKHVFHNVAWSGCKCITLADLMRFLGDEETSIKALALFEGGLETGKITKQSLVTWVVNVYRERRALSFSLNDTKTAVNKLHRIIDVIMVIIILIIWLLVLGIATTHLLVALSSQLVLVVFVFGNTCKTVFEAIVFLFAMHPFDVGDRCVVDGVQMVVEEMNILSTVFLRYDNEKIYYPNSVLATKPISNYYRSPDMGDAIDFSIHISTSNEKIEALKAKIKKYIDAHAHHWYAKHDVVMKEIEDMNRIRMALWLQHTMNHQNAGEKWIRRSQLLMYLKDVFQELDIDYRLLPQEVHLRDMKGL